MLTYCCDFLIDDFIINLLYVAKSLKKVLLQQQKSEIEEAISQAQAEHIIRCAQENEISLLEFDQILQPIVDSCTKDSISNGNYETSYHHLEFNGIV